MRPAISAGSGSCPNRETGHRTARRVGYSKVKFAPDSPQEGAGFEPSVPRDTPKFSTPAHVTCLTSCTRKKVGANENRYYEGAGRGTERRYGAGGEEWQLRR